ncbi:MAG: tetratricopeptide repeat protein [Myxococcales bacterium]|nr:tetratricopeptide repeat protein [Myxococcales bacterium]
MVRGFMAVLGTRSVRRPSEAVRLLEDHLRVAPDDPVRSLRLGNLYLQLGDVDAAEARWRKVQELAPDDVGTAIALAHVSWNAMASRRSARWSTRSRCSLASTTGRRRRFGSTPHPSSSSPCWSTSSVG